MNRRDPDIEAWVDRARSADIWQVLGKVAPGHGVKRRGHKGAGPCPVCGGKDRFSVNGTEQWFYCRKSDTGGDAIRLVEYVTGANFLGACEIITGESMPKRAAGDEVRREDPALLEQRRLDAEAEAQRRAADANAYRDKEIGRARTIWGEGEVLLGTPAEDYLRSHRGVQAPAGARLRFHPDLPFWHPVEGKHKIIHRGPALLARIDDNAHRFIGCHCTYLDLEQRKGKACIPDPETGEILDAKKVRGSQKGGHIHLGGSPASAWHLIMGEGLETTLTSREVLLANVRDISGVLFWAAVNLGNMGGPSAGSVNHPTLTSTDKRGRTRRLRVPGPVPLLETKEPVLVPPAAITTVTLLGDGDSDRFATEQHLLRGAARWAPAGVTTRIAWPPAGEDFNGVWTKGAAA
jgi:hypothetical protein